MVVGLGSQPSISPPHWVSDDGRYVLYNADNGLTVGDLNGPATIVSPFYNYPTMSDDGRYVAFLGNGAQLWDRTTGLSERVSLTDDDQPATVDYYGVTVSGNGRYVAFRSSDPALTPPGWDYATMGSGIFLRDRTLGTTVPINSTPGGGATSSSVAPSLSDDAGVAAWPGALLSDTDTRGIVVWKRASNSLSLIPGYPDCCSGGDLGPMVSGDGRYVVWSGDAGTGHFVWIYDLQTGNTTQGPIGASASVSDDGRYVAYSTDSGDAYRLDRQTGTTTQVNVDSNGTRIDISGSVVGISGDGSRVAFGTREGTDQAIRVATIAQRLTSDVYGWGQNSAGDLAGLPASTLLPTLISGASGATSVGAGGNNSLATTPDGHVLVWGSNAAGGLGIPGGDRATPTPASPSLTNIVAVAEGWYFGVALNGSGGVWTWGNNSDGQQGDGTVGGSGPVRSISGLPGIVQTSVGLLHVLALDASGRVYGWGANRLDQINGSGVNVLTPTQVTGLPPIQSIGTASWGSLAVDTTGHVWLWGYLALSGGMDASPRQLPGITGAVQATGGQSYALALDAAGTVYGFGDNRLGQLGDGTTGYGSTFHAVPGLPPIASIATGANSSYALARDGDLYAWGDNAAGQLGDGTSFTRLRPVLVASGVTQISTEKNGGSHVLAIGSIPPTGAPESSSGSVTAGGSVTTDTELDGTTTADRIETTVTSPVAGSISITEAPVAPSGPGFRTAGGLVTITAPAATAASPLQIRFSIDLSALPIGVTPGQVAVLRNGSLVLACTGAGATPDPCLASRTLGAHSVDLVIRTSHASLWSFQVAAPIARSAATTYNVSEGSTLNLDASSSTGIKPLAFDWGSDPALSSRTSSKPTYRAVNNGSVPLTLTVTDANGLSDSLPIQINVANVPPKVGSLPLSGSVKLGGTTNLAFAFADAGTLDTHTARVDWGDGTHNSPRIAESHGIGAGLDNHKYTTRGTYTVTVTVTDNDGAAGVARATIKIT